MGVLKIRSNPRWPQPLPGPVENWPGFGMEMPGQRLGWGMTVHAAQFPQQQQTGLSGNIGNGRAGQQRPTKPLKACDQGWFWKTSYGRYLTAKWPCHEHRSNAERPKTRTVRYQKTLHIDRWKNWLVTSHEIRGYCERIGSAPCPLN
jgi:hypothetical protein